MVDLGSSNTILDVRHFAEDHVKHYFLPKLLDYVIIVEHLDFDSELRPLRVDWVLPCWFDSTLEHLDGGHHVLRTFVVFEPKPHDKVRWGLRLLTC